MTCFAGFRVRCFRFISITGCCRHSFRTMMPDAAGFIAMLSSLLLSPVH